MEDYDLTTHQPTIEQVLHRHKATLGADYDKYRNHVYRVFNYSWYLLDYESLHQEKLAIAAAFHDLGIWTHQTFDYLQPSIEVMRGHLNRNGLEHLSQELTAMITYHHKLTPYKGNDARVVEAFRKADQCDITLGVIAPGIPAALTRDLKKAFPYAGFHRFLTGKTLSNIGKNPLRPLPMFKW